MTSQRGPRQNVDDQDVSAATTDMWELDVTNCPETSKRHHPPSRSVTQDEPPKKRIPSGNISEVLNTKLIARISKDIGSNWKLLAAELDFKDPEIQTFAANAPLDQVEQTRTMLSEWVRRNAERGDCVAVLVSALRTTNLNDVALNVMSLIGDQPSHSQEIGPELRDRSQVAADKDLPITSRPQSVTHFEQHIPSVNIHGPVSHEGKGTTVSSQSQTSKETRPLTDDQPSHSRQMSPELRDPSQVAADNCNAALKARYRTTGSYVNINPFVDDDERKINIIYVKLQLEKSDGTAEDTSPYGDRTQKDPETLKSIEYEKIFFIEGGLIKRLIFCGKGGVGKSTFFDKIAYDWAVGSSDVLNKYKLVFVFRMCALDQSSNLIEAIFDQLLARDVDISKEALDSFILKKPNDVLILLDGFDELTTTTLTETSFGSILRALNRQTYRECCIGVTTRPSHFERLRNKSLVQNPCIHLKVLGFTKDDVEEYVRKFFPGNIEALIKTIQRSDVLSDLARSPMLLVLMCAIWREDAALPLTMSRLYSEAVDNIFKRKGHESDEEISEVLIKIGEVALNGLLDPKLKLAFPESEFEKNTLALALKVGILNSQRVLKNRESHNSIQFLHKTMQELCAAKYFQSLPPKQFENILDRVCDGTHISEFEHLLHFCCGDNEVCMKRILIPLLNRELNELALHCYFEGQLQEIPSETYIKSLVTDTIHIGSNSDLHSLMFFLSNVCKSEFGRNYLGIIECITLEDIFITESVDLFALALSNMTNVQRLILYDCSLSVSDLKTLLLSLKDNTRLNRLSLKGNTMLGGTASQWAPHIQHLTTLRDLSIHGCNIQPEDMEHIMKNVSKSKSECEVRFYNNKALGGKAEIWSRYLCLMIYIKELDLSGCSLVCNDIEHIANALSEMPNLTDLYLEGNSSLGGSANVWSRYLCHMIYIKKLDLGGCSLVCNDIEHIANALSEMPNLTDLYLWNNSSLGGSANVWSRYLCLMIYIKVLDLRDCSLVCNDIEHIANALSEMPNLTHLYLWNNSSLGGSANVWSRYLCRMIYIKKLYLGRCSLVCNDIEHIANALSEMPNLTHLDLWFNSSLGGSANVWSRYLCLMKHLQVLYLTGFNLDSNDKNIITQSLSKMTNPFHVYYS